MFICIQRYIWLHFLLSLYLQFQTYDDIVVGNSAKEFLIYGYVPLLQNAPLKSSISTKD